MAERLRVKVPIKMLYVIGPIPAALISRRCRMTPPSASPLARLQPDRPRHSHVWMGGVVTMFTPFFHGEVRLFRLANCRREDWIATPPLST